MTEMATTQDRFLDGRLIVQQPKSGYRAATDPVFLAASVPAKTGERVLELGCGVGVASLCLGVRVGGVNLTGLEIQADYAALARENAKSNGAEFNVIEGDLTAMPAGLRAQTFDHVFANPPFFEATAAIAPGDSGKAVAHMDNIGMTAWVQAGTRRVKPGGTLTIIQKVEQLPEILSSIGNVGVKVLPVSARRGQAAKRIIVQLRKNAKTGFQLLPPFIVHTGDAHIQGHRDYSEMAENVLRHGERLSVI